MFKWDLTPKTKLEWHAQQLETWHHKKHVDTWERKQEIELKNKYLEQAEIYRQVCEYPRTVEESFQRGFDEKFYADLKQFYSNKDRRCGKTYNLAKILVELAIENGGPIYFTDHFSVFDNNKFTIDGVRDECLKVISWFQKKGCDVITSQFNERSMTLIVTNEFKPLYRRLCIEQSVFDTQKLKDRIEFLEEELLLIC